MGYEIDFLPVGDKSSGGDAITLRYGNLYGTREEQTVVVIDGGYASSGAALVEHIGKCYDTDKVDIVISTHPDDDHINGLEVVLQEMEVGELWMHLPWKRSASLAQAKSIRFKTSVIKEKLTASLQSATDLEEIAKAQRIPIIEPFAGTRSADGVIQIFGPTLTYYEELLAEIMTPGSAQTKVASMDALLRKILAGNMVSESLTEETLSEDSETSTSNNTSAICLLSWEGRKSLFTGDAGILALNQALDLLEETEGFTAGDLSFVQVPHHGSQRNVSPSLLNRLLGPKGETRVIGTAFASVPPENPKGKHPSKKATNAFRRRGYPVHLTQGTNKLHHYDAPERPGYATSTPEPLHEHFEDTESS